MLVETTKAMLLVSKAAGVLANHNITKVDIESLVSAKVSESRTLDYKQQLPDSDPDKKREFLYDVSSFANAAGGDMVFGIADEMDADGKSTGLPASVEGVNLPNVSDAIARLENLIRDWIMPRISGIEWKAVDGFRLDRYWLTVCNFRWLVQDKRFCQSSCHRQSQTDHEGR